MEYSFKSVIAGEFRDYLDLRRATGAYMPNTLTYLSSLDKFLVERDVSGKNLPEEIFIQWLANKQLTVGTKANMLCTMSLFSVYMRSLGYSISVPEKPRVSSDYTPRLFSKEEFERFIATADSFQYRRCSTRALAQFPILLRILYGCGLRLKEALLLAWRDVDLDDGVLTIRRAKNQKERFVPMSESLTEILRLYQKDSKLNSSVNGFVFENRHGNTYATNGVRSWFNKVVKSTGVEYTKSRKYERGLCPHCLRHQFVLDSFLKAESEGRSFEEMVPFLSAYLGHSNILETEKYLRASYELYTDAQRKISDYISDVFPEVRFDG